MIPKAERYLGHAYPNAEVNYYHDHYMKAFADWLKAHCEQRYERQWIGDDYVPVEYMLMKLSDFNDFINEATSEQPRQVE